MVKPGYKQTEIGVIPEDWEVVNLEGNFTLKARIGWQGLTTAEYLDSGDYYLITGTDFKNGYIDWDNCVYVAKERFDQDRNIQIKQNDVLITKDGTIGKIAFIDKISTPTTLNSGVFVARPKNSLINNRFFYYVLMSFYFDDFLSKITAGSTITHLYQKDFVHFNFTLPPPAEQEAIAAALSDADTWIESLEQLITKKRLIKQGAMQTLLTPKEDWVVKNLGDIGDVRMCKRVFQYETSEIGEVPFFKIGTFGKEPDAFISRKHFEDFKQKFSYPKVGEVLISAAGTIGRIVVYDGSDSYYQDSNIVWLENDEKLVFNKFLKHLLGVINYNTEGGTIQRLYNNILKATEFNCPSLPEQTRIATILSDMDAELETLENQLAKARQIKQGMMQELLTGRVRLV